MPLKMPTLSIGTNVIHYTKALVLLQRGEDCYIELEEQIDFFLDLGSLFTGQGEFDKAESCLTQAIEAEKRNHGNRTEVMASLLKNLGVLYKEKGIITKSISVLHEAKEIAEELEGDHKQLLGWINHALGQSYQQHPDAEDYLKRSLELLEECFGPESDQVGKILSNVGTYYLELEDYEKAEPLYHKALENLTQTYQGDHPDVAAVTGNLGVCIYKTGKDPKLAMKYLEDSLRMKEKLYDEHHFDFFLQNIYLKKGINQKESSCWRRL